MEMGRTKQDTSVGGEKDVQRCTARIGSCLVPDGP